MEETDVRSADVKKTDLKKSKREKSGGDQVVLKWSRCKEKSMEA